ncbi:hypothetical protein [Aeromonas dhakensis]|uniref:hypothetical protein n=1 Tax=Aeromonas dhakensis TaxID=196024 RepID=UPI0005AA5FF3|nr:hypothetical protein [Aeromonas dhakensis]
MNQRESDSLYSVRRRVDAAADSAISTVLCNLVHDLALEWCWSEADEQVIESWCRIATAGGGGMGRGWPGCRYGMGVKRTGGEVALNMALQFMAALGACNDSKIAGHYSFELTDKVVVPQHMQELFRNVNNGEPGECLEFTAADVRADFELYFTEFMKPENVEACQI